MGSRKRLRGIHHLTAIAVQKAGEGDYSDGGGLILRVRGTAASWVFRFTNPARKRREMGLGVAHRNSIQAAGESIKSARKRAQDARKRLDEGFDPIEVRDGESAEKKATDEARKKAKLAEGATLARVARAYHERVIEPNRTPKHAAQWINSLEQHVPASIWHAPINKITPPQLLDFFLDVTRRLPETGSRITQRLCRAFGDGEFRGLCKGNAAAAAAQKLRDASLERDRGRFAALDYTKVPAFMVELRKREGIAARALEFAILTAARTGEVIDAMWPEFYLEAARSTVPARRMKGGKKNGDHLVYLAPRSVEILKMMQKLQQPFAFPSPSLDGKSLSNMAMLALLRRMDADKETTVHGICRSTFSTWANETGAARRTRSKRASLTRRATACELRTTERSLRLRGAACCWRGPNISTARMLRVTSCSCAPPLELDASNGDAASIGRKRVETAKGQSGRSSLGDANCVFSDNSAEAQAAPCCTPPIR
ncbi:MAG TPA: integrase arm-type DNA-binding domain-containing protein [Burkholderiaceae bacterium]|nr:integrase arm-type DNA-binding domain-containing protein [Burkholderiaceae bacterium]